MANISIATLVTLFLALTSATTSYGQGDGKRKPYIIHMIKSMKPPHFSVHEQWYASLIDRVSGIHFDPSLFLYSYDILLHGFAAKLTSSEARAMESMDGCLSVIPSSTKQIHTTHSPTFLGLSPSSDDVGLWSRYSTNGSDIIVGVVDTGIWPESKSFHDQGLEPVPSRWKGQCQTGEAFASSHCNRKIIGARYYFKGYEATYGPVKKVNSFEFISARDGSGHGTHTASTVAGYPVAAASFKGFGQGTAVGMAPGARLAIYKVCWGSGDCDESDIAAGMEQATADGVDIISLSITGPDLPFYSDPTAIAGFGAMQKGVLVSTAAGNFGPFPSSIVNTAPWLTTVGASNMDRQFTAPVILGNHKVYRGISLSKGNGTEYLPLVYASQNQSSRRCLSGSLDPNMVKGKIVVCDQSVLYADSDASEKAMVVKKAGGVGMVVANEEINGAQDLTEDYSLWAASVSFRSGEKIKEYINSSKTATATIHLTGLTVVGKTKAPIVAAFSSRGPSDVFPDILKPDLIAPGVNILAATFGGYYIDSGTSMACPHVSGISALIRATHPSWSPAAIKSALMTSSQIRDNRNHLIRDSVTLKAADAFAMGAGHVNPTAAMDPGLVYDITPQDYLDFLCSLNYTEKQIGVLTHKSSSCLNSSQDSAGDLNYPSFSVIFKPGKSVVVKGRTVTNVGECALYNVIAKSSRNVNIYVEPETLEFTNKNEKASFSVRFESKLQAKVNESVAAEFGEIAWRCVAGGTQIVRSPVAIVWQGD